MLKSMSIVIALLLTIACKKNSGDVKTIDNFSSKTDLRVNFCGINSSKWPEKDSIIREIPVRIEAVGENLQDELTRELYSSLQTIPKSMLVSWADFGGKILLTSAAGQYCTLGESIKGVDSSSIGSCVYNFDAATAKNPNFAGLTMIIQANKDIIRNSTTRTFGYFYTQQGGQKVYTAKPGTNPVIFDILQTALVTAYIDEINRSSIFTNSTLAGFIGRKDADVISKNVQTGKALYAGVNADRAKLALFQNHLTAEMFDSFNCLADESISFFDQALVAKSLQAKNPKLLAKITNTRKLAEALFPKTSKVFEQVQKHLENVATSTHLPRNPKTSKTAVQSLTSFFLGNSPEELITKYQDATPEIRAARAQMTAASASFKQVFETNQDNARYNSQFSRFNVWDTRLPVDSAAADRARSVYDSLRDQHNTLLTQYINEQEKAANKPQPFTDTSPKGFAQDKSQTRQSAEYYGDLAKAAGTGLVRGASNEAQGLYDVAKSTGDLGQKVADGKGQQILEETRDEIAGAYEKGDYEGVIGKLPVVGNAAATLSNTLAVTTGYGYVPGEGFRGLSESEMSQRADAQGQVAVNAVVEAGLAKGGGALTNRALSSVSSKVQSIGKVPDFLAQRTSSEASKAVYAAAQPVVEKAAEVAALAVRSETAGAAVSAAGPHGIASTLGPITVDVNRETEIAKEDPSKPGNQPPEEEPAAPPSND